MRGEDQGTQTALVVDTLGLNLGMLVTGANVPDREGAARLLPRGAVAASPSAATWADCWIQQSGSGRTIARCRHKARLATLTLWRLRRPIRGGSSSSGSAGIVECSFAWFSHAGRLTRELRSQGTKSPQLFLALPQYCKLIQSRARFCFPAKTLAHNSFFLW